VLFRKVVLVASVLISVASPALPQAGQSESSRPVLSPRGSENPSFDCSRGKTLAARLICADGELARFDGERGVGFQRRKAQIPASDQTRLVEEQLAWIRDGNARCELVGKNTATTEVLASWKPCMLSVIQERVAYLAQTEPAVALSVGKQIQSHVFYLDCFKVDNGLLRSQCQLAEAVLNRDCAPLQSSSAKALCNSDLSLEKEYAASGPDDTYHPYLHQLELEAGLHHVCDANFIPIVANECAIRRARLEKLKADNKARVTRLRAQAQIGAEAAFEAALRDLRTCVRNHIATLIIANETAEAVAAAAVQLCDEELRNAARASDYYTSIQLWFEGLQPKRCADGSPRCIGEAKIITDELLPRFAAQVMQTRAEAVHAAPDLAPQSPQAAPQDVDTLFRRGSNPRPRLNSFYPKTPSPKQYPEPPFSFPKRAWF
jgi:uncharacterized protein YecT (DUF1311 family)